ncbi:unnamed protein product [Adineta ricciae]|uniref:SOCS box domain-containing protein n=1 Tax=Adineta ricciae TaxID=249248 RepID=A0A815DKN3_ADIRI|nr:unnamed protein product [Adineta ricciae]CAF1294930.1 unnamed protein product [Adineta ricciae]
MGTNNSKETSNLTLIHAENKNPSMICKSLVNNQPNYYCGWQEICRCSHADWLHGNAEFFGFAPHKFICNSELHSVCAPGFCSESLSHKLHHGSIRSSSKRFQSSTSIRSKKLREHFEYNHIPAMISSLQNYSVHGIVNGCSVSGLDHGDTIMLLIYSVVLEKTKFIIVDLKLNRYVCAIGDDYNGLIDARKVHAACSMDRTQVIVRVPLTGGATVLDFYKIVKKESKLYRRIVPVDITTQFQFCPNYWSSRLAFYTYSSDTPARLMNYTISNLPQSGSTKTPIQTLPFTQPFHGSYLCLVNVHTWSISKNQSLLIEDGFRLLSLVYTPDSVYLILTFVDNLCHCGQTLPISYFDIYHGNTLQRLQRIYTQLVTHVCPWHMCRNPLTPIFSRCSSRMAFCTTKNNGGRELQVSVIVLPNDLLLKSICRRTIIHYLNKIHGKIEDITGELPDRLNQYIQYRPEFQ